MKQIDIGFNPINKKMPIVEKDGSKRFLKNFYVFLIYAIPAGIVFTIVYFITRAIIRKYDKNNKLSNAKRVLIQIVCGAVLAIILCGLLRYFAFNGINKIAYSLIY